ncbi:MAG: hypothetical protein JXQ90_12520 [Cyclobacteriaceae bacterium]
MKHLIRTITAAVFFVGFAATAQPGWNWGEQVDKAKEQNALYVDLMKAGKMKESEAALKWLLENTPDLNVSLYQNGIKIYDALASKETDAALKAQYVQTGLDMHDKRIEYFQKEDYVTDRKATFAYKYYNKDREKYEYLYNLFAKSFELNGNDMLSGNLVAYMNMVYKYKKVTKGDISEEEIIEIYFTISDALNAQKESAKEDRKPRLDKMLDQVDKLLAATVELDCDMVEQVLGPKFSETKDVKIAKKIFQLMLTGKCTDRALAFEAARIINEDEPTYTIAKFLGVRAAQNDDPATAKQFYDQAVDLTDDNLEKADIYMYLAKQDVGAKDKVSARGNARRALAFDPSRKDAYSLIGNLYMGSFDDCKQNEKKTHDYAIFIAAYNMYKRAGDSDGMANAKALFPSIEDIFNDEYQEGQSYQVGCWINETVTLERRSESN